MAARKTYGEQLSRTLESAHSFFNIEVPHREKSGDALPPNLESQRTTDFDTSLCKVTDSSLKHPEDLRDSRVKEANALYMMKPKPQVTSFSLHIITV